MTSYSWHIKGTEILLTKVRWQTQIQIFKGNVHKIPGSLRSSIPDGQGLECACSLSSYSFGCASEKPTERTYCLTSAVVRQNDCSLDSCPEKSSSQEIGSPTALMVMAESFFCLGIGLHYRICPGKVYMRVSHGLEVGSIWGRAHLGFSPTGLQKGIKGIHKDKIYVEPRFLEVARARRV